LQTDEFEVVSKMKFFGYLHNEDSIHTRRYYEPLDINEAKQSPFIKKVFGPFEAANLLQAELMVKYEFRKR